MPLRSTLVVFLLGALLAACPPLLAKEASDGPPAPTLPEPLEAEGVTIEVELGGAGDRFLVTFVPHEGHKVYSADAISGIPVSVATAPADGIEWGGIVVPGGEGEGSHDPLSVEVPFRIVGAPRTATLTAGWQVCLDDGQCLSEESAALVVTWDGTAAEAAVDTGPDTSNVGGLAFPVREGDAFEVKSNENRIEALHAEHGLLVLAFIFGFGVLLAFTPCVLPIIPITVAVVSGGGKEMARRRQIALLSVYVLSLATTFGLMGVAASLAGASMSAAFESPYVIGAIALLFLALAFGMLGLFELQPPQWLMRVQGGAQTKGGSLLGAALLGGVMALVASPCTGPFIVGMGVVAAKTGSLPLGFAMFSAMGLGMGAVFFAAGALNLVKRPGPWMVYVRYGFGVILFGAALYYAASAGLLGTTALLALGGAIALVAAWLLRRHLVRHQGEAPARAGRHALGVAVAFLLALGLVAWIERPEPLPPNVDPAHVAFRKVADRADLVAQVQAGLDRGQPIVVDLGATWCKNCDKYEALMVRDATLRHELSKLTRLKIDVTTRTEATLDLRAALGIPRNIAPFIVFLDRDGTIRRGADIDAWHDEDTSAKALKERLRRVLGDDFGPENGAHLVPRAADATPPAGR